MRQQQRDPETGGAWLQALRVYTTASVILHLVWEVLQLPLYTIWSAGRTGEIIFAIAHCTAGDAIIASLALLAALVLLGKARWPAERPAHVALAALLMSVSYTIYSEWLNTVVRKSWAYSEYMPVVPGLGTGVAPLLQWLIVPSIAFIIAANCASAGKHAARPSSNG